MDDLLLEPLKIQGAINYFNGINLRQSQDFFTVNCQMYLDQVFERHRWTQIATASSAKTIPITADSTIIRELETKVGLTETVAKLALEKEMKLSYRVAIRELIYALITCRPDIGFSTTKLSQYSVVPAKCHYAAVKNVFCYLLATKDVGLTYWRPAPKNDLPDLLPLQPVTLEHE